MTLFTPRIHMGGKEVQLYRFLTSLLDEGEWSTSGPGRFSQGKEHRYPLNGMLGGPRSRCGRFGEG